MNYRHDLLKQKREQEGWTYEYIAEQAGLSTNAAWKLINGHGDPSASSLVKIFKSMGFKPQDALTFKKPRVRRAVVATAR